MRTSLAFGEGKLLVEVPAEGTVVVEPTWEPGVEDPLGTCRQALARPVGSPRLRALVQRGQRVAISVCDGTRPQPRDVVVPALLEELDGAVDLDDVVVLVATGTHRGNTPDELRAMFGDEVLGAVVVENHDARRPDGLSWCGELGDHVPVWLNRQWVEADVRITTGFVEPHFFAGFSGGPKMVAPGLAGLETTLRLHDARRIGDPRATWGRTVGNPVHDDIRAIAEATGVDFALDVVLNREHEIVSAFAGALSSVHDRAVERSRLLSLQRVEQRFDVVLTSNAGYPLDQNLYQAVKGISAAAQVVADGGLIVCCAECRDGIPDHGPFGELLRSASSPAELLDRINASTEVIPDQWEAQILARIQTRCQVAVHATGLDDATLRDLGLGASADPAATVADGLRARGPSATLCVLPSGPETIPYVQAS